MALGLAELGEDVATTAQRLIRFEVHPVVAHDAATWAHRLVRARSEAPPAGATLLADATVTSLPSPPSGAPPSSDDAA